MSDWLHQLDWHWWWIAAGALLGILEILLPGIFLIWIAVAAWITAASCGAKPLTIRYPSSTTSDCSSPA